MSLTLPHWFAVFLQVLGGLSLACAMAIFALVATVMAHSHSAERRKARDAERNIERARNAMRFVNRYGEEFRAYGVELRAGPRTRESLLRDPLHRPCDASLDDLIPFTIDVEDL